MFLGAINEIGLLGFELSDLEQVFVFNIAYIAA
jgi:hypothetical protein